MKSSLMPEPSGGPTENPKKRARNREESQNKDGKKKKTSATQPVMTDCSFEDIGMDLAIKKVETSKDKIEQPELAKDERKIIPPLGSSVIISGKSGSGKSTLLQNLMTDARFYGPCPQRPKGWFAKKFLFAPTGASDDILKAIDIPEKHVFTEMNEGHELLKIIQESQKNKLKGGKKAHEVDQFAVIFEDVIGETSFMNTTEFKKMFYMVRHLGCTTFICTQHFNKVPKICRLQGSFVFFFAGSQAEVEIICDMFAPPMYTKKEFMAIVNDATKEEFNFFTICMKTGWKYRFRRNLGEFLTLSRLVDEQGEMKKQEEKKKGEDKKKGEEKKKDSNKSPEMDFYAKKVRDEVEKYVSLRKSQHYALQQQTDKVLGEWACKGARGRTLW
jgi:hypothetical protein